MKKIILSLLFFVFTSASAWGESWTCGNVTVDLTGTTLTISPVDDTDGIMEDLAEEQTKWRASGNRGNVKTIIIKNGVKHIGEYAFYYCLNITSIEVPLSVESFGSKVFYSTNSAQTIYYKGTPNQWANIDFADGYSHPFYGGSGDRHIYFYNQTTTETTNIVFTPGITTIKAYAFYYANNITNLNIPHSVTSIEDKAFYQCTKLCRLFVNNTNAPTTGTDVFYNIRHSNTYNNSSWLYLPVGANNSTSAPGFKRKPWYDSSNSGNGATCIGYQGTDKSASTASSGFEPTSSNGSKLYPTSGYVDGIKWELDENGIMTFSGSGEITTTFISDNSASDYLYPWHRFCDLVDKVVITGGVTGLSNALGNMKALREVEINQTIIPTSGPIGGTSTTFASLINTNTSDKITLRITDPTSRSDDSWSNLSSAPWNHSRWEYVFPTACSDWSLHYGTDGVADWDEACFTYTGSSNEWQIEDFVIPDKPNWYVDNAAGNDAKKKLSTWGDLYFAASQGDGARPMVGNAVGAVGTVRIYDNSNWNNRYAGFIPNGYVLKFGSDEYSFALESSNVFHSEIIEYNSTSANYNVSVGIENADREYVSTDHTQEMRHIFLKDDCNWSGDYAKLAIYYWNGGDNGWCGFLQLVPGETGLYEGWIPSGYTNLKFVRFNSSKTSVGNWDDEWNETGDLSIGSSDNMFTMSAFSSGSWSTYERKGKFVIHTDYTDKNWYVRFQPQYVLHFDANGGEGAPATQYVAINADPCQLTVSATEPTRTGYDFLGWSTNSDATSPDDAWDPGDTHAMTGDVTLYAVWSPATLTFNASEDANWNNANNWSPSSLPTINHEVIINKPATVNTTSAVAKSIVINQNGGNTGQLVVDAGQKLIVAGTIKKTTDGETYSATEANDIIIHSDARHGLGLGALVMGTHDGTNQATVNFTTLSSGTSEDNTSIAQYVGTPFNDETNILHNWYNSWVYGIAYTSNVIGWERVNEGQGMAPFKGYCVFSADGTHHNYWQQGKLVASTNQTLSDLNWQSEGIANPNNENLLANSWMAPIQIDSMKTGDFINTEATIYIFNSGSPKAYADNVSKTGSGAAQYSTYTIKTSGSNIIPSMQSFSVFTKGENPSVTLNYNKLVYQAAIDGTNPGPNRAPRRIAAEEANKIRLFVRAESGYGDMLYMWERSDFSEDFENGWDGHKLFGEAVAPQLFALSPDGNLAINCIPTFEGVQMGFKAGEQDNSYTFTFEYSDEAQPLYLLDISTNTYTQITSATSYSFTTTDTDVHNRFVLTYNAPSTPTALETTSAITTGKKVMYDNHLFILHNGRIFSAQGAMIQ